MTIYHWIIWLPVGGYPWRINDHHDSALRNKNGEVRKFATCEKAFDFTKKHNLALMTPEIYNELHQEMP